MEIGYEGYDLLPGPIESRGRLSVFRSVSNYTTFLRLEAGHVYVVQATKYKASLDSQGQQRYEWGFWVVDKNTGTRIDPISELNKSRKDIPTLNADVGSLVFFESDQASGSRTYGLRFPRSEVRYIYWQLFLQHPSPEGRLDFDLEAVWIRRSDGSVLHRWVEPCTIQKGWTWSIFGKGYGSKEAGSFNIGIYIVELYIKGNKIASSTFEIY